MSTSRTYRLGPWLPASTEPYAIGDSAPPVARNVNDESTPLIAYGRCNSSGWLVRVETDGNGGLREVKEKWIGTQVYGSDPVDWDAIREAATRPQPIAAGSLRRSAARMGRQVRVLGLLARTNGTGMRARRIAELIGTSPKHVGNIMADLNRRGLVAPDERHIEDGGRQRLVRFWKCSDDYSTFLAWALLRVLATEEMTPSRCAQLMGLNYEQVNRALAQLYGQRRVYRAYSIDGYVYRLADMEEPSE